MRGDFHLQFQADVAIGMHSRRKIYIHSNIQIGELRIYKRAYATRDSPGDSADAGRKTARGDRYAIPNAQLGGLAVHRPHFRILNNLRI